MRRLICLMLSTSLVLIAAAAVACGQDTTSPPPTVAPVATSLPEAQVATSLPAQSPAGVPATEEPAATLQRAAPSPRPAAAATSRAVAPPTQEPERESLKVISSRSMALPSSSSSVLLRVSGFDRVGSSVNPQTVPTEGGLTVSAIGSVTVAADEAYVVIVPEQRYGPSGPEQMTADDRKLIRDSLAEIGVPEDAVEFVNLARYGPSSISVDVSLDELAEKREQILDIVEEVIRRSESHGVLYSLTEENCESALSLAPP